MEDIERPDSLSGENEELVTAGFSTDDDKNQNYCHRVYNSLKKTSRGVRFIIIVIIVLMYYLLVFETTVYAYDYTNSTNEQFTTRLIHNTVSRRTCEDTDYGCCKIYYNCKVINSENPHLDFKSTTIDVYRINAHDTLKSNCPSLRSIINRYNQKYGSNNCGDFGCCDDFNKIKCDDTIHNNLNNVGNGQRLIDHFNSNSNTMSISVPKIDEGGSNCWNYGGFLSGIPHFINKYEHYYPDPEEPCNWICIILRILALCFVIGCFIPKE